MASIEVRTGRKWRAEKALDVAESSLWQKAMVSSLATGRAELGYFPKIQAGKTQVKERHHRLQEEVRAEDRVSRSVGLWQQGAWTITWSNIMQADFHCVQFLVQAIYDALPSPTNLHVWRKSETPFCPLCSGRGLEHVLSCCPKALADYCYRWRHDQVLKVVTESIAIKKHHSSG